MKRHRVQAIVIQDKKVLFGYGCIDKNNRKFGHFFIGGGVEDGESPEDAILREIMEEANVTGDIIFKLSNELKDMHTTFLVTIGNQEPLIGYDPEEINEKEQQKALQKLIFIPLKNKSEFTEVDVDYFKMLLKEFEIKGYFPEWYSELKELISC